jgi:hypothetical protein
LWKFGAGVSLGLPLFDSMQGVALMHESEFAAESLDTLLAGHLTKNASEE